MPGAVSDVPPSATVPTCYRHPDRRGGVICQRCDRHICPQCMHQASVGFHCPECTKAGKQKVYTRANMQQLNRPLLTQILVGINVAVFVVGILVDRTGSNAFSLNGFGGFIERGGLLERAFDPELGRLVGISQGEWWRIVTSGFLHGSPIHLLFNMLALWRIGEVLEPALGRAKFGAVYGTSLLMGSFGAVLTTAPNKPTVGASGAIFGLFGVLFLAQRARGIDPWSSGIGMTIGLNLLITFSLSSVISVGGHVGGLAGGLLCGYLLFDVGPKQRWATNVQLGLIAAIGLAAAVGCVVASGVG